MIALDVNVLISALRRDATDHDGIRQWLEGAVDGTEPVGVSDTVLGGVLRVLTNPRVFASPTPLDVALSQIAALRSHPNVVTLVPGARHWQITERLCRAADARGHLVADAQHAALAVEHGATWISKDRDFARFAELRWRVPGS